MANKICFPRKETFLAVLPFLAGAGISISSAMNSSVGQRLGSPWWGAMMSKVTGFGAASLVVLLYCFKDRCTLPWLQGVGEIRAEISKDWTQVSMLFGFIFDAAYTLSSVTLPYQIGYGTFFVAVVCGQVIISIVIDLTGFLWNEKKPFSAWMWVGLSLVVGGTVLFRFSPVIHDGAPVELKGSLLALVAVLAGAIRVVSAAFNRKINSHLNRLMVTGAWIFGSTGLFLLTPTMVIKHDPAFHRFELHDFWLFLAFFFGLSSMSVNIIVPPKIGYAANYAWTVCGQLFCSMLMDALGFLKAKDPVTATKIGGAVICLVGASLRAVGAVTPHALSAPPRERSLDSAGEYTSACSDVEP